MSIWFAIVTLPDPSNVTLSVPLSTSLNLRLAPFVPIVVIAHLSVPSVLNLIPAFPFCVAVPVMIPPVPAPVPVYKTSKFESGLISPMPTFPLFNIANDAVLVVLL